MNELNFGSEKTWPGVTLTLAGCLRDRSELLAAVTDARMRLRELQSSGLLPVAAMGVVSDILRSLDFKGESHG